MKKKPASNTLLTVMRITGGRIAGRKIECPPGIIRPAMDRMRESLFSILGPLDGTVFADLFSGSGMVGLEAYSRGAKTVLCVEKDPGKKKVILKNLELAEGHARLFLTSVERFILSAREAADYVYLDPPFDYPWKADLLSKLSSSRLVNGKTLIIIHFPEEDKLPENIGSEFVLSDKRKYGRSIINFYRNSQTGSQETND